MKDINRYNSIQELKDKAKSTDPGSAKSTERHNQFEHALSLLRQDYLKSKSLPENNVSEDKNFADGL